VGPAANRDSALEAQVRIARRRQSHQQRERGVYIFGISVRKLASGMREGQPVLAHRRFRPQTFGHHGPLPISASPP